MPVNAFNGTHNWGYDGVAVVRGPRGVRRPRGLPALRRRLPRRRARRDPGRRLQPPRSVGQLPAAVRALPQVGRATPGATWSTSTARARAEVRRYILDNVRMWLADYHVDGLRLDAVHALDDSSDVHLLEEMAVEVAALSAHLAPAADADRGVRPQRPAAGHAARGRRLRAGRAVERRLPPRRARRADPGDRRATTPTSSRCPRWPRCASAGSSTTARYSSFRGRDHGDPIDTATMPTWRLVVVQPEPRPDRQPRASATGSPRRSTTTSSPARRC